MDVEPSDNFFSKLDTFITNCSQAYPSPSFKPDIEEFKRSYPYDSKHVLKKNFERKEVQDEFNSLFTAIMGNVAQSDDSQRQSAFPCINRSIPPKDTYYKGTATIEKVHEIGGHKEITVSIKNTGNYKWPDGWKVVQVKGPDVFKLPEKERYLAYKGEQMVKIIITKEGATEGLCEFVVLDRNEQMSYTDPFKLDLKTLGKGGQQRILNPSNLRINVTKVKAPAFMKQGTKYDFSFTFTNGDKYIDYGWKVVQTGGDKIEGFPSGGYYQIYPNDRHTHTAKQVMFTQPFKDGVYSFAIVDKAGNNMHPDKPIEIEIYSIEGMPKSTTHSCIIKDVQVSKKVDKEEKVTVRFKAYKTSADVWPQKWSIKEIGGRGGDVKVEFTSNIIRSYDENFEFSFVVKDKKCKHYLFAGLDKNKCCMFENLIEVNLDNFDENMCFKHFPETAKYREIIKGRLSIKNTKNYMMYKGWKLENANKDSPVEELYVHDTSDIPPGERREYDVSFIIAEPPKKKFVYTFAVFSSSGGYKIDQATIEFKDITGDPMKHQKMPGEITPMLLNYPSMTYKGKITGSWYPKGTVVKDNVIEVKFRVLNTGSRSFPKDIAIFFVKGSPIYDFKPDVSGIKGLRCQYEGHASMTFKINDQLTDTYCFNLAIQKYEILSSPLKIQLKLGDTLGACFPKEKTAPPSKSSQNDNTYMFHNQDEILRILLSN